jgi:hypothetical protein
VIHLTKRVWAVPDEIDVYMPEVPFLTKVSAGKTFEERLQLPLPLTISFPYQFATATDEATTSRHPVQTISRELIFSIGYLLQKDIESTDKPELVQNQSYFTLPYGISFENQRIVTGKKIAVRLEVLASSPNLY